MISLFAFMPPIGGFYSDDVALLNGVSTFRTLDDCVVR